MKDRITPMDITHLEDDHIFVFGSNLMGTHGAGAARQARLWGATYGHGIGPYGDTYAIPTKDAFIKTMSINDIIPFVDSFIVYAKNYPKLTFLVTQIGCGLAGYTPADIAPLFRDAVGLNNVHLPESFWEVLNGTN